MKKLILLICVTQLVVAVVSSTLDYTEDGESKIDEAKLNTLKMTLDLYWKYHKLLDENMFFSSAQKKLIKEKFKHLKNLLINFLNENSISKDVLLKVNSDLQTKKIQEELKTKEAHVAAFSQDNKLRQPFKWG